MRKINWTIICAVIGISYIFASGNLNQIKPKVGAQKPNLQGPQINTDSISKGIEEQVLIDIYKEKSQSLTEVNERILSTFSLTMNIAGLIGSGLLLFIGATWWRNTKYIRSKIQEVEAKFEGKLSSRVAEINRSITTLTSTISDGISTINKLGEQRESSSYYMGFQILELISGDKSEINMAIKKIHYASRCGWEFVIPAIYEKIGTYIDSHQAEASSYAFALNGLEKNMEDIGKRHPDNLAIQTAIRSVVEKMQAAKQSRT